MIDDSMQGNGSVGVGDNNVLHSRVHVTNSSDDDNDAVDPSSTTPYAGCAGDDDDGNGKSNSNSKYNKSIWSLVKARGLAGW